MIILVTGFLSCDHKPTILIYYFYSVINYYISKKLSLTYQRCKGLELYIMMIAICIVLAIYTLWYVAYHVIFLCLHPLTVTKINNPLMLWHPLNSYAHCNSIYTHVAWITRMWHGLNYFFILYKILPMECLSGKLIPMRLPVWLKTYISRYYRCIYHHGTAKQ